MDDVSPRRDHNNSNSITLPRNAAADAQQQKPVLHPPPTANPAAPVVVDDKKNSSKNQRYFNDRLAELVLYRAEHGNSCHGIVQECNNNQDKKKWKQLAQWITTVRQQYKNKSKELTKQQILMLESLGLEWTATEEKRQYEWQIRYGQLQAYYTKHGHVNVTATADNDEDNSDENTKELSKWVERLRRWKKRTEHATTNTAEEGGDSTTPKTTFATPGYAKILLKPEQIEQLDKLGFVWNLAPKVGWESRFEQLVEYKNQHGHVHVPQLYAEDRAFGRWVMKQRVQYHLLKKGKKSQMNQERIERLDNLGFAWIAPNYNKNANNKKATSSSVSGPRNKRKRGGNNNNNNVHDDDDDDASLDDDDDDNNNAARASSGNYNMAFF